MKKLSFLLLAILLSTLLFPVFEGFRVIKKYTYQGIVKTETLQFSPINEPTASTNGSMKNITPWQKASGSIGFQKNEDMFTLLIPRTFEIGPQSNPVRITLHANGKDIPLSIDLDGDGRDEEYYYTDPIFVEKTNRISYTIEARQDIILPSISLVGLDTDEHSFGVAF